LLRAASAERNRYPRTLRTRARARGKAAIGREMERENGRTRRKRNAVGSEFLENIIIIGNNARIEPRCPPNSIQSKRGRIYFPDCTPTAPVGVCIRVIRCIAVGPCKNSRYCVKRLIGRLGKTSESGIQPILPRRSIFFQRCNFSSN